MAASVQPLPDLRNMQKYSDDYRFVVEKQQDHVGQRTHRQYICDCCGCVVVRRSSRFPEFDGQFLYLDNIPTDNRNPLAMKKAWRTKDWNASFWCTACWCKCRYCLNEPLREDDKWRVRIELGLVKMTWPDVLWWGVGQYGYVHTCKPERHPRQGPLMRDGFLELLVFIFSFPLACMHHVVPI